MGQGTFIHDIVEYLQM